MFEKLGWMLLAKRNGWHDKVETYKNSVHRLCMAIERKIKEVREADRKDDLTPLNNKNGTFFIVL